MSRLRSALPWLLALAVLAAGVAWFLATHERVSKTIPLPPRGEASYNPLYALKLALRADGQRVESRQRLQLDEMALAAGDTLLVYSDPRGLTSGQLEALFLFAEDGGHLVLRLPSWQGDDAGAGDLAEWLPIEPDLLEPHCMDLFVAGEDDHVEFCDAPRFELADDAELEAAWRTHDGQHVFARFAYGDGSVDLLGDMEMIDNGSLDEGPHIAFARQLLAPNWGKGRFHLVYAADMPPLWRWLLLHAWAFLLPLLLALLAWLWMRMQRFGPLLARRCRPGARCWSMCRPAANTCCATASSACCTWAMRDAVLARLRRRDPLAAAQEGETQVRAGGSAHRTSRQPGARHPGHAPAGGRQRIPPTHCPPDRPEETPMSIDIAPSIAPLVGEALGERVNAVRAEVGKAFIGQEEILDQVLMALLAGGHVLLEGVPGLGKTLLVRALAQALGCAHARVQFTPDLMPSDVSGHAVYDPKAERFKIRRGPVFTNLLLADEINRAPAKTQSALLEVMQEGQVTIEGTSLPAAAAVPVPGHAEPGRTGRHLSAAGSAARSLPAEDPDRLSATGRREAHGRRRQRRPQRRDFDLGAGAARGQRRRRLAMQLGTAAGRESTGRCSTTPCASWRPHASGPAFRWAQARAAASRWCARRARRRCWAGAIS